MSDEQVPAGWEIVRVCDAGEVQLGRQRSPENHTGPHMRPYLRVANVYEARIDTSDVLQMNFTPEEYERFKLEPGDVLLNEGQSLEYVGRPAIYRGEVPGACFQNTLVRFRANSATTPSWALLVFRHYLRDGVFQSIARWTTNIAHLGSARFAELPFPIPPLAEQNRITAAAEELESDIDAGVASLERVLLNLKRYRATVLKAACEGKLVPTEAELARNEKRECEPADVLLERILKERRDRWEAEQLAKMASKGQVPKSDNWKARYEQPKGVDRVALPKLPEQWTWASLECLTTLITSGSRGWGNRYADAGPLFVRAQDIKTDRLTLNTVARVNLTGAEEGSRTRVAYGDLLVTITGANVAKTATVSLELEEAYVSQHVGLVRPVLTECTSYLHAWIVSPAQGRRSLEKAAYGAGKPGLNLENLRELRIGVPPLAEQCRIVAEVERLLSIADEAETAIRAQLKRAERLRQALLKHAFEGKLVPTPLGNSASPALIMDNQLAETQPTGDDGWPLAEPRARHRDLSDVARSTQEPTIADGLRRLRLQDPISDAAFMQKFALSPAALSAIAESTLPLDPRNIMNSAKNLAKSASSLSVPQAKRVLDEIAAVSETPTMVDGYREAARVKPR